MQGDSLRENVPKRFIEDDSNRALRYREPMFSRRLVPFLVLVLLGGPTPATAQCPDCNRDGAVTVLKQNLDLLEGEVIDGTYMSRLALIDFLTQQVDDARQSLDKEMADLAKQIVSAVLARNPAA